MLTFHKPQILLSLINEMMHFLVTHNTYSQLLQLLFITLNHCLLLLHPNPFLCPRIHFYYLLLLHLNKLRYHIIPFLLLMQCRHMHLYLLHLFPLITILPIPLLTLITKFHTLLLLYLPLKTSHFSMASMIGGHGIRRYAPSSSILTYSGTLQMNHYPVPPLTLVSGRLTHQLCTVRPPMLTSKPSPTGGLMMDSPVIS